MVKELIIFLFSLDHMDYVLFIPATGIGFLAGLITMMRGIGRNGHRRRY